MRIEHWRSVDYQEENLPPANLTTRNPTWTGKGASPDFRGERLATNRLSIQYFIIGGKLKFVCINLRIVISEI
jgi:hypothetical protein